MLKMNSLPLSLTDLPPELLTMIFLLVDPYSIWAITRTSRGLRRVVVTDEFRDKYRATHDTDMRFAFFYAVDRDDETTFKKLLERFFQCDGNNGDIAFVLARMRALLSLNIIKPDLTRSDLAVKYRTTFLLPYANELKRQRLLNILYEFIAEKIAFALANFRSEASSNNHDNNPKQFALELTQQIFPEITPDPTNEQTKEDEGKKRLYYVYLDNLTLHLKECPITPDIKAKEPSDLQRINLAIACNQIEIMDALVERLFSSTYDLSTSLQILREARRCDQQWFLNAVYHRGKAISKEISACELSIICRQSLAEIENQVELYARDNNKNPLKMLKLKIRWAVIYGHLDLLRKILPELRSLSIGEITRLREDALQSDEPKILEYLEDLVRGKSAPLPQFDLKTWQAMSSLMLRTLFTFYPQEFLARTEELASLQNLSALDFRSDSVRVFYQKAQENEDPEQMIILLKQLYALIIRNINCDKDVPVSMINFNFLYYMYASKKEVKSKWLMPLIKLYIELRCTGRDWFHGVANLADNLFAPPIRFYMVCHDFLKELRHHDKEKTLLTFADRRKCEELLFKLHFLLDRYDPADNQSLKITCNEILALLNSTLDQCNSANTGSRIATMFQPITAMYDPHEKFKKTLLTHFDKFTRIMNSIPQCLAQDSKSSPTIAPALRQ